MKAVLISIQPRHCENIASGKKTIEVRKTAPKIPTPFKCYIYETKAESDWRQYQIPVIGKNGKQVKGVYELKWIERSGKVIGEFVCDEITRYEGEFWDDETYEAERERNEPDDFEEYGEYEYDTIADNEQENYEDVSLFKKSCLTWEELRNYLGKGDNVFYGWHISDLKIYDKPKELGEFKRPCNHVNDCCTCKRAVNTVKGGRIVSFYDCDSEVKHPPQSWMYVEEI